MLDKVVRQKILRFQESEITEHHIYQRLALVIQDQHNREILQRIAGEELKHYQFWKRFTEEDVKPSWFKVWKYVWLARLFGLSFGLKLMEMEEGKAQSMYRDISAVIPEGREIEEEEQEHEKQLLNLMNEELLEYVGSAVLGLNDALVELTGALAGLTFALQNTSLVATAGFITGIAASFSMAASEYLSIQSEESGKNPVKAAIYTGVAYIGTVLFLICPFILFKNVFFCLTISLMNALFVILVFTFYISVAKGRPFKKRFFEMAGISLGVAGLTFIIGLLIRTFLKIEVG